MHSPAWLGVARRSVEFQYQMNRFPDSFVSSPSQQDNAVLSADSMARRGPAHFTIIMQSDRSVWSLRLKVESNVNP